MTLEAWHWWVLSLLFVVFAAVVRGRLLLWMTLGSALIGTILWFQPEFSLTNQLLLFGLVIGACIAIAQWFAPEPADEADPGDKEGASSQVAPDERILSPYEVGRYVGRVVVLQKPIVNGFGEVELDGHTWRIRGEDTPAGRQVEIVGMDGIHRNLLIVEPVEDEDEADASPAD